VKLAPLSAVIALLVAAPLAVAAEDGDDAEASAAGDDESPAAEKDDAPNDDDFGHFMQVGLRAGFVAAYGMSFRYDDSPFCNTPDTADPSDEQQSICGFGKAPATELALSFALLDSVEPYAFARLAFSKESRTDTDPIQMFGLGARIYTRADSRLKVFVEPAIAFEVEGGAGSSGYCGKQADTRVPWCGGYTTDYKKDLVFHLAFGPQYDFAKYVGVYLNGGLDVGILRSISAALVANLGLQVRVP
jgi:hypothetical protein